LAYVDPPINPDDLPQENDGVQVILQSILPSSTPDNTFNKFFFILWYLWKARNDNRFNRRTWNPWQIHYVVQAHMATHSLASPQHQNANPAPTLPGLASPTIGTPSQMDRYMVLMSTLLPGIRCFVDASTQPDQTTNHVSLAGIGILIVNTQVHPMQTTYIKAAMTATHSVITAEAAAMALAAMILNRLRLSNVSFLSDCSQLVQFLNDQERHNPPD
jgi:hypothetical protein